MVVCDCLIKATEPVKTMNKVQLKRHSHGLGVFEYEKCHKVGLKKLIKQYHVGGLPNMLLSPGSRKIGNRWVACF